MPLLFLERFPWPSLRTYTGLSGLALLGSIISAYRSLSPPEAEAGPGPGEREPITAPVQPVPAAAAQLSAGGPGARDVAQYLLSDSLFVWVSEAVRAAVEERGGWRGPSCHPLSVGGVAGVRVPPLTSVCEAGGWGGGGRGPTRERAAEGDCEVLG